MITLLIIAYVLNVFLNRWLSKILYTYYNGYCWPFLWFTSLVGTLIILAVFVWWLIDEIGGKESSNWFTGKYW
jgi:hypothetical protein